MGRHKLIRSALALCASLAGCRNFHWRPNNVPSSAVWVDGTFVTCDVDASMKADRCTVFEEKTGTILVDGLFVLDSSKREASKTELHYVAVKDRTIFLADARTLSLMLASDRDPSNSRITESLKSISASGAAQPINCGKSPTNEPDEKTVDCALNAFEKRTPFYIRFYVPGMAFDYSYGLAGDSKGKVSEVVYNGRGINKLSLSKKTQLSGDSRLAIMPCPKPVSLMKTEEGTVACALPVVEQELPRKPVETSICEIAKNPWAFNNKMVRVRGHVWNNFEYSEISGDDCESIWFTYGGGFGPPGLAAYVAGGATPGAENEEGDRIAPIAVRLIRDSNFQKFERLMVARAKAEARFEKSHPGQYGVFYEVIATFVGRIDGVSPEIHAAHLKRSPMDRADHLGFGQMGLFDAQLVVQSVEGDAVLSVRKDSSDLGASK